MKIYNRMTAALPFLFNETYHPALIREILFALYCIEQLVSGGELNSFVAIAETKADIQALEKEYVLDGFTPEIKEQITAGEEVWLKRVYILDDAGNGIIIFQRTQNGNKKRTE